MSTETTPASRPTPVRDRGVRTIGRLWRDATARPRDGAAYLVETRDGWQEVSWESAAVAVEELANGLLALGIAKGDAFGILARTRLEWTLFDFALALVGGVTTPIYPSSSADDCGYALTHVDAVGVLVEDAEQRAKIESLRLAHVLEMDALDELRARGRTFAAANPAALDDAVAAIDEDDLYTFIYTSGTTGPPKACMLRHRNYYAMTASIEGITDFTVDGDVMFLYLPLAHNFGRLMSLWGAYAGFTIAFCPDPLRVAEALPQARPTILPSVPRVFEKVHTAVRSGLDETRGARRRLAEWALAVGREASTRRQRGEPLPRTLALRLEIADRLVFSKVRNRLGGRIRVGICGGAPLAAELGEFFHGLGLPILEGYGLTECTTAASVNRPTRFRFGTVGPAMPGTELAIAADGEVLIRSETVFAGYWRDEEATRAVLGDDGWLRSGDIGELSEDGFLTITDRKKDILVTAGGKNVAPQNLENALKTSKYVSQALAIGDRRPYVTALITLEAAEVEKWRAAGGDDVQALVQGIVDETNNGLSRFEQIKRFAILPREFSAEEGEVTPTLKLKRRVCEEHFAAEIDELYR